MWEYRDQIFLISACIQNHIVCWSKNGCFSVWDGSGVEACIFCVECDLC